MSDDDAIEASSAPNRKAALSRDAVGLMVRAQLLHDEYDPHVSEKWGRDRRPFPRLAVTEAKEWQDA